MSKERKRAKKQSLTQNKKKEKANHRQKAQFKKKPCQFPMSFVPLFFVCATFHFTHQILCSTPCSVHPLLFVLCLILSSLLVYGVSTSSLFTHQPQSSFFPSSPFFPFFFFSDLSFLTDGILPLSLVCFSTALTWRETVFFLPH